MRALAVAIAFLFVAPETVHRRMAFDRPINDAYRLRGIATYPYKSPNVCCTTALHVALVDRRNPSRFWRIADISHEGKISYKVQRADERSIVLSLSDPDYGSDNGNIKAVL